MVLWAYEYLFPPYDPLFDKFDYEVLIYPAFLLFSAIKFFFGWLDEPPIAANLTLASAILYEAIGFGAFAFALLILLVITFDWFI